MSYAEFFPVGNKSVEVRFKCDNCGNEVLSEEISVPSPNYAAEKASDSHNDNDGYAVCEKCEKEFEIWVYAGYADGYVDVQDRYRLRKKLNLDRNENLTEFILKF